MPKSIGISLLTAFQLGISFAFQLFILKVFGLSSDLDIYLASTTINVVFVGVASGVINYALTPVFIKLNDRSRDKQRAELASSVLNITVLVFSLMAALQVLFADIIVSTLFPGFVGIEKSLLSSLFSIQSIISVITVAIGVLNAINYAQNRLYRTILVPILAVLVQFVFVYFTYQGYGIYSVVWALGLGQIFIFIFLSCGALYRYRPTIVVNRRLRYVSSRMIPLILSSTFSKSDIFVNRHFASLLDVGSITILHYGLLSITSLSTIVDKGVGIISLRKFSLITNSDREKFTEYFKKIYSIMIYLVMTISAFIVIFVGYFLEFLFLGDKFNGEQIDKLSIVVISFIGVFIGGVLSSVLVNAFYSKGLTSIVSKMSVAIQSLSIIAKISLFNAYGFYVLPIVTSAHYLLASFCLVILYDKYIFRLDYLYFLRALLGSCVVFLILVFTLRTFTERFFPFI